MKCPNCNYKNNKDAKFCLKCGTALTPDGNVIPENKKKFFIAAGCCLGGILLIVILLFILIKADIINNPFSRNKSRGFESDTSERSDDYDDHEKNTPAFDHEEAAPAAAAEAPAVEEAAPVAESNEESVTTDNMPASLRETQKTISDQAASARNKFNTEDYSGASEDLRTILEECTNIASEYDFETVESIVYPLVDEAFPLYVTSTLKQVQNLEEQTVSAPLYQQIDSTLLDALDFSYELQEYGLNIDAKDLEQYYTEFPDRYKEKFILTFNELRTGNEWSRTTAWSYMQDAVSVGLVDKDDLDDPLTQRYMYALALITQKDLEESLSHDQIDFDMVVDSIVALAESTDYNPILMDMLLDYENARSNDEDFAIIGAACMDVFNYLVEQENIYITGPTVDYYYSGRIYSGTAAKIDINDLWYFNDFGKYSPSNTNGVSPAGRQYIRKTFEEAINSLRW